MPNFIEIGKTTLEKSVTKFFVHRSIFWLSRGTPWAKGHQMGWWGTATPTTSSYLQKFVPLRLRLSEIAKLCRFCCQPTRNIQQMICLRITCGDNNTNALVWCLINGSKHTMDFAIKPVKRAYHVVSLFPCTFSIFTSPSHAHTPASMQTSHTEWFGSPLAGIICHHWTVCSYARCQKMPTCDMRYGYSIRSTRRKDFAVHCRTMPLNSNDLQ